MPEHYHIIAATEEQAWPRTMVSTRCTVMSWHDPYDRQAGAGVTHACFSNLDSRQSDQKSLTHCLARPGGEGTLSQIPDPLRL